MPEIPSEKSIHERSNSMKALTEDQVDKIYCGIMYICEHKMWYFLLNRNNECTWIHSVQITTT